jgi:pyrimidine operon attenuation protein/uracil phosphoribosyltransferase
MKKLVAAPQYTDLLIRRLTEQLVEDHQTFENTVLIGLQPKGGFLLAKIEQYLKSHIALSGQTGLLDITFYRDDFRRKDLVWKASSTDIDFLVEGRQVVLIDDVLFTGRSVRSAFDALISFGRPSKVQLMVLVDRLFQREFPIKADYVGMKVNTLPTERVNIDWDKEEINIWITKEN